MMSTVPAGFRALPLSISQLSLATVLKCGQSFRWYIYPLPLPSGDETSAAPTHEYRFCLRDRLVCLRQSPDALFYKSVFPPSVKTTFDEAERDAETLAWVQDYFQLNVDLDQLYADWSTRDAVFKGIKDRFSGIRMLRQDPWENLLSFICSSNNHISRIGGMVKKLSTNFSPPLLSYPPPSLENPAEPPTPSADGDTATLSPLLEHYHPFPLPTALLAQSVESKLRTLGFGYRAAYIQRTAALLVETHGESGAEAFLHSLRTRPTAEAREELLKFVGVGRKVADCVLLMSLDKREVVPVDTHVQQIAAKHYGLSKAKGGMTPKLYEEVNTKLVKVWGPWAGWAHSVLFTSDLQSFATHGLPSPSPSIPLPSPAPGSVLLTTSSAKAVKRKRTARSELVAPLLEEDRLPQIQVKEEVDTKAVEFMDDTTLAERIKKRRRARVPTTKG